MIKQLIEWFLPKNLGHSEEAMRRGKMVVWTLLITWLFTLNYASTSFLIGYDMGMKTEFISSWWYLGLLFFYKKTGNTRLTANLCIGMATICIGICCWHSGGFWSPVLPWLAFPGVVVMLISEKKSGWLWVGISSAIALFFGIRVIQGYQFPKSYDLQWEVPFSIICIVGLVAIIFLLALVYENAKNTALGQLAEKNTLLSVEKRRSDDLLNNILPEEVTAELKETGKTQARHYEEATVLFADVRYFTKISEQLSPQDLVSALDAFFGRFDAIVEANDIEKVKTIGDSYLCVGGVPIADPRHAHRTVKAAIEMLEAIEEINESRRNLRLMPFEFRIGVHTGPLVAGVVGVKKFAWDIWGDTVNTAARMQESSEAGRINLSGTTFEKVKNEFQCTHRGKVEAKNKGEVDMYFVEKAAAFAA